MNDPHSQVVVYTDARPILAQLVRDRLEEAGIQAFVENLESWLGMGDLPGTNIASPRVIVAASDADKAREIVAEFNAEGHEKH